MSPGFVFNDGRSRRSKEADMSATIASKRRSPGQIVADWWQSWTASPNDFACCAQEDVERMAHDIGVSAAELRELSKLGPHAADQLLERMKLLHLDPQVVENAEPPTFHDLQRSCSLCDHHKRCEHDLAAAAAAPEWEHYCPNAATLKVLSTMPWP